MANYLYNGVELPDINTVWDKETYPYMVISKRIVNANGEAYYVGYAFDMPYIYSAEDDAIYHQAGADRWFIKLWEDVGSWQKSSSGVINTSRRVCSRDGILWTSVDIVDESGAVIVAASDPIPVGDTSEPIDPNALLQGYLVGRAVASMRK